MGREEQLEFQYEMIQEVLKESEITPVEFINASIVAITDLFLNLPETVLRKAFSKIDQNSYECFDIMTEIKLRSVEGENHR